MFTKDILKNIQLLPDDLHNPIYMYCHKSLDKSLQHQIVNYKPPRRFVFIFILTEIHIYF